MLLLRSTGYVPGNPIQAARPLLEYRQPAVPIVHSRYSVPTSNHYSTNCTSTCICSGPDFGRLAELRDRITRILFLSPLSWMSESSKEVIETY